MHLYILLIILVQICLAFPGQRDEVVILPGLRIQPKFKHYSGYLNGSDTARLHYWFVESQGNASSDPLVLWMNGGPGCSSLDGLLTEHGPFRLVEGGYLDYNMNSWNKVANIIYLESPVCVGFSYSTDGKCIADDDSTSSLNYNALKDFFVKFPQYKSRDFYIAGESYGGIYVPTLAERVVLSKEIPYIRLKGIGIGNAYSSNAINWKGIPHFVYNHGLISDSLWTVTIATCCHNVDPLHCDIISSTFPNCHENVKKIIAQVQLLNPYNIYAPCLSSKNFDNTIFTSLNVTSNYERVKIMFGLIEDNNFRLLQIRKEYLILKSFYKKFGIQKVNQDPPCTSSRLIDSYLNTDRVKYALHIPSGLAPWTLCSDSLRYKAIYKDMDRQYKLFFNLKDFKIWLYNGDVDLVCSYLSEEWYFEQFNRKVLQSRKPWMYNDENNSSQVGGFVKSWDRFSLITIRGAGHMVPTDKPRAAFHLFESFIKGKSL